MNLQDYYLEQNNRTSISRQQASDFAKNVANDFNPIHDPDNKRFCVPGDLLFALGIHRYGLSQQMRFIFSGLVGNGVMLNFPQADQPSISITGDNNKIYLSIEKSGDTSHDKKLVQRLICNYVTFSGQTFPHILIPLMAEKGVMINPERPLIIYESMEIDLLRLDIHEPELVSQRFQSGCKRKTGQGKPELLDKGCRSDRWQRQKKYGSQWPAPL